jgi:ribonucleoside-diphosphate reductase alpha chain
MADGTFDVPRFLQAATIFITAQEILVDHASYPTPSIAENSHRFRPLGLGYANLGSLLMSMGIPYVEPDRGAAGHICRVQREPRADAESDADASRCRGRH